jgi:hypothetical protein
VFNLIYEDIQRFYILKCTPDLDSGMGNFMGHFSVYIYYLCNVIFRELSAEALLDLDIFNLSATDKKKKTTTTPSTTERRSDVDEEDELDDNTPLFWQPGKRGFYSPRPGKNSPERLNAFRNVGR